MTVADPALASSAPPSPSAAARLAAWYEALPPETLAGLARRYRERAAAGGATMQKPDGRVLPIPPLLTPEVLDSAQVAGLEENAHALLVGLGRLTEWIMSDPAAAALRAKIFHPFGPLEAEGLRLTFREAERLATARVDYLVDVQGVPRALEVNATIPAMQGYSDIVAEALLVEVGAERGNPPELAFALADDNGRNSDQLLASLLAHDAALGGGPGPRRIVIVHRAGDSQIGELSHHARRFTRLGHPTVLATPEELSLDAQGDLRHRGLRPDVVYRHVFARRLEAGSAFARALLEPRRHHILNPIASHLEVKAMLGLLSQAASVGEEAFAARIGLSEHVVAEVRRSVPWTRLYASGPTRDPDGEPIADLPSAVAAEGARFVLKRSWDYGGRGVFLGADFDESAARRAQEVLGLGPGNLPSWAEFAAHALADPSDAWVVQALVPGRRSRHLVAGEDSVDWKDLYVDLSVYTNLGVEARPRGGVSRAALGRIVNLQGGGGLAPLIRADVIERLLAGR